MMERRAFLKAAIAALGVAAVATTLTPVAAEARMPEPALPPQPVDPARHAADEAVEGRRFFFRRRRRVARRRAWGRRRRFGW